MSAVVAKTVRIFEKPSLGTIVDILRKFRALFPGTLTP
jgi:hypothetical protein